MSFACSPVPYNTSSDSPYARPVKPEDLFIEEADQVFRIEPGDSLEVVVRRGAGEERSLVTVRDNGRVYVGSLDIDVRNLTLPEAEARITEQAATIIRNPRVEVSIKQKKLQLRKQRVFLLGGGTGQPGTGAFLTTRSEEHTSELQSRLHLVCRLLLEKKKNKESTINHRENRYTRRKRVLTR